MELRLMDRNSGDMEVLERINEEAIPENERNSLDDMIATRAEVLGIYEGNEPVGFMAIRITHRQSPDRRGV